MTDANQRKMKTTITLSASDRKTGMEDPFGQSGGGGRRHREHQRDKGHHITKSEKTSHQRIRCNR